MSTEAQNFTTEPQKKDLWDKAKEKLGLIDEKKQKPDEEQTVSKIKEQQQIQPVFDSESSSLWRNAFASPMDRLMRKLTGDRFDTNLLSFNSDIIELFNEYQIYADLPGMDKNDINIFFKDGNLQIEAKRLDQNKDRGETTHRCYCRNFQLSKSTNIDAEHLRAKYENGVLMVTVPKQDKELVKK